MNLTEKYAQALINKDYESLSDLFDYNGSLMDHCPEANPYRVYGREAINMFFRNRFFFGFFSLIEILEIGDGYVTFVARYDGKMKAARATIIKSDDGKKIRKVTVRPA